MLAAIHIQWVAGVIFIILYSITILGLVLVIIAENRNPLKTIPWVIVLLLAPGIGLLFYFFFGQDNRKQRIISRRTYKRIMKRPQEGKLPQDACTVPGPYQPLVTLLNNNNQSSLLYGSEIKIYTNGADKFKDLLKDIQEATHHIHIQYYIFCDDEIGTQFKNALITKAKEGVKVRLLYDDVGCWNVKNSFFDEMQDAGIEVHAFLKVAFPVFTSKVNYRNHRKIVVIDGQVGYMGGMNIALRYMKGFQWGIWRDTHIKIEGKAVYGLQTAFLTDWYVVDRTLITSSRYFPEMDSYGNALMQIVTSDPVGEWRDIMQGLLIAISSSRKYFYIQTPYLLPTEPILMALKTAALAGVDIRIMIPERADTRLTHLASLSYLDDMMRAGVKIYLYQKGFLHSKLIVSDDTLSTVGSTNMDFRSFEHNFEVNAFMYDRTSALILKEIFLKDQKDAFLLQRKQWIKRPWYQKVQESTIRLLAPLL